MTISQLTTYLSLCTEFYDLDKPHDPLSQEFLFYLDYARQANGLILEPMCGTGRFLIPMFQEGLDIEGFDASLHMLNALKQKYAAISSQEAPVWQQFVQDFGSVGSCHPRRACPPKPRKGEGWNLGSIKKYNLIFIPFGSWGLITDREDVKKSLANMHAHLAQGGKLVLEIETVASVPEPTGVWRRGAHRRADGSRVVLNALTSYDQETQVFKSICRYESVKNDVVELAETEDFRQFLYRFDEMDELLREAGFTIIKKYQDFKKSPAVDAKAPLLIYECGL